jgi:hypothetical protein
MADGQLFVDERTCNTSRKQHPAAQKDGNLRMCELVLYRWGTRTRNNNKTHPSNIKFENCPNNNSKGGACNRFFPVAESLINQHATYVIIRSTGFFPLVIMMLSRRKIKTCYYYCGFAVTHYSLNIQQQSSTLLSIVVYIYIFFESMPSRFIKKLDGWMLDWWTLIWTDRLYTLKINQKSYFQVI